jgi:hypothetical protein
VLSSEFGTLGANQALTISGSRVLYLIHKSQAEKQIHGSIGSAKDKTGHRHAARPEDASRQADCSGCARFDVIYHAKVAEPTIHLYR